MTSSFSIKNMLLGFNTQHPQAVELGGVIPLAMSYLQIFYLVTFTETLST